MQSTARVQGLAMIGIQVPEGSDGDRLLAALGYRVRWTSWILELPAGATIVERPLPAGYTVRQAAHEEHRALHTVVEDAFLEWSERDRESFEDFAAVTIQRPGFEPWNLRVVTDPDDAIIGVGLVGTWASEDPIVAEAFISRLAVRRDQRGQGIAQALMVDAFAVGRGHGAAVSRLSTDSRSGALGLYEKVGMVVVSSWVNRAIALT